MTELILHHYAGSPFSEKVRLVLGYKGLSWKSVTVPVLMPKPDVMALTGGYRRTPFLQIGADIYCDTALMCRVIDRLAPTPPLYPANAGGAQHMMAHWADTALFWSAVPYTLQPAGLEHIFAGAPEGYAKLFGADRAAMTAGTRRSTLADARAQLQCYLGWLEQQLQDGRPFLCGDTPCIADFSVVQSLWFIRRAPPVATILEPHARLRDWADRMLAFGHGTREKLSSAEAIAIAAAASTMEPTRVDAGLRYAAGDAVTVTPTDYAFDPVAGRLCGLTTEEVAIERHDERAGRVVVHFPRVGFQVRRAEAKE